MAKSKLFKEQRHFLSSEEKAHAESFSSSTKQSSKLCGYRKTQKFCNRDLLVEQRAQTEAVFRLMIDSVVGLAILLVILSALNYFDGQTIIQSKSDFFSLVKNAVNTPTGTVVRSGELTFPANFAVDTLDLQSTTFESENCFQFQSMGSVRTSSDSKKVTFSQRLKLIVYAKCNTNSACDPYTPPTDWGNCCTQCIISFGKALISD